MRPFSKRFILLFALCLGFSQAVLAAPDRDRPSEPRSSSNPPMVYSHGGGDIVTGNCDTGTSERDLDVNNVLARAFNNGSLFFGGSTDDGSGYLVPQASGRSPVFASGLWVGGMINGEIRVAGSRYANFEFWPGPLNNDGTLPNPDDCLQFDRIYKVSRQDIQNFNSGAAAATDLADWPAELGAPVIAAPNNGINDDGDGLLDEGTDGLDNDGDGLIDERDEQERRIDGGYDLAAGDRPEIVGDQALWWVMNDVGNSHAETESNALGVEVQVLAFSFARADALGETTFYRYRVINKNSVAIQETYLSVFSDPDLGDAADDYIGSDTDLSLGFVYNGDDADDGGLAGGYGGNPPALGYDFFQGPIVDLDGDGMRTDTLGLTRFTYFTNEGGTSPRADPATATEYFNHMRGLWKDGVPYTEGGLGYQTAGAVTKFAFPGDPVTNEFWSEGCPEQPACPTPNQVGDRRLVVHTGPFVMEPLVPQDIVFGIVFAQGGGRLESITALRAADQIAQAAYDVDFELPTPPPAPPACLAASTNPQLLSGSGFCAEAVEQDEKVTLVWGYPEGSENYLGSYTEPNFLLPDDGVSDRVYDFEGFNIYQYPTSGFPEDQRQLIATFDIVNGIDIVRDERFDPAVGVNVPFIAANGSDSGLQYFFDVTGLTNYTDYFYGISAYAYIDNELAVGSRVLESPTTQITARPSQIAGGDGGSFTQGMLGDVIVATRVQGDGVGAITVTVVDPTAVTGATYRIEPIVLVLPDSSEVISYRILRDGQELIDGEEIFNNSGVVLNIEESNFILDGLLFAGFSAPFPEDSDNILDFAGDGKGIIETMYAGDENTCPDPNEGDPVDGGVSEACDIYDGLGNSVFLDGNINDDYYITANGGGATPRLKLNRMSRYIEAGQPTNFEMRYTDACEPVGSCLGVHGFAGFTITSVPFELWNIGADLESADDDVRMIPFINANGDEFSNWANNFTGVDDTDFSPCDGGCPTTDWVYWLQPDRPTGYTLFAQAANGFGGPGAVYDAASDGDTDFDPNPVDGTDCNQGVYVNYCFDNQQFRTEFGGNGGPSTFVYPIGRMLVADLAQDGTTPPAGTTIRYNIFNQPLVAANDIFEINTADFALVTGDAPTAEEALDLIGIVPNPYMGRSAYETGNLSRVARFTNLPEEVVIRVYTVAGTLVKTLTKDGPSRSLDWNLTTDNNLPVASGMYLIHVDVPGLGERILKFGVVQRRTRITVF